MLCCPPCSQFSTIVNNIVESESGVTMMNNIVESESGVTMMNNIFESESGVTMLNNIVDNCEQCEQHNIVEACSEQHC